MKKKACSKLLIIGGYGTFGGRLAGLLADDPELTLMIAGRSLHKAEQFAKCNPAPATLIPVAFDRDGDVAEQIARLAPDLVVDASGPFQTYGESPYRVADAAISIGAHYLDLADSTEFVCNVSALDEIAKRQDVFVLAGASTCPTLTSAVARHLSNDLVCVESVSGGIAPSPFAGMGRSVVQAIAGYAGKPVQIIRNGRLEMEHTFASTRKFTIAPLGYTPLPPMTFSLIDVPDLRLLDSLGKPVDNTWFGVSTTPSVYHRFLRLLARGVKAGILPTLRPLAGIMHFVMNHLSWGERRGGMFMEVRGTDLKGQQVQRSWHLIAEGNDGPTVPALAAAAIIRRCVAGRIPEPGARPAMDALDLNDFLLMFKVLDIRTGERSEHLHNHPSIFERVLGEAWHSLPAPIRELHRADDLSNFAGLATIKRGDGLLARILGWVARLPDASTGVPVAVRISPHDDREIWDRDFDGYTFSSEMSAGSGRLEALMCERFGPCKFGMALVTEGDALYYISRCWTFLGIPMPKWIMPNGRMVETVAEGKFVFHVEITIPLIGHVVTYEGSLEERC